MPEQNTHPRTNLLRRSIGSVICFAPAILLVASLIHWVRTQPEGTDGLYVALAGLLIAALNSWLSIGRPLLYRWRRGSFEGYRHVSGFPLVGTVLLSAAGVWGFGMLPTILVALAGLLLDTGGSPWFLIATWRDRGLWDEGDVRWF